MVGEVQALRAYPFRGPAHSLGQDLAELALPVSDGAKEVLSRLDVAEFEVYSLRGLDQALLRGLDGEADHAPGGHAVQAQPVAELHQMGHGTDVADSEIGADESGGLVFHDIRDRAGVAPRSDGPYLAAADGAAHAGRAFEPEMLGLGGLVDLVRILVGAVGEVAAGQEPGLVGEADGIGGAGVDKGLDVLGGIQLGPGVPDGILKGPRIADRNLAVAPGGDRLEVLGAHDGARTAAAGLAVVLAAHQAEANQVLPGLADGEDSHGGGV